MARLAQGRPTPHKLSIHHARPPPCPSCPCLQAGASTSQVKRAAEEEAEPATAAAPAVAAPESASKRQKLADADGTASVAGAAVSGAAPPPHDAEMREAGEELGPQQEEQQQEWQQRQQPRELMLYAETQVLDPYGAEESDGNDGGPAPAPTAAEAGAAASPASSDAAPAGEGGDTASEEDAQRRQPPAAALIPPTQVHPGLLFATRSFATMPHMQLGGSGQLSRSFFLQAVGFMEAEEEAEEEEEEVEEEGEAAAEEAAEETLRGHEQQEEQQGQEQPAAAGAGQPGWEQPAEAQPLKLDTAAAAGPLAVPSAVATAAAATAAPPPKPSGRASRPGAGSVAADVVGATVRQCGELLQDVRAVLFDQGGGTGSSLATAQRAAAWLADVDAMQQRRFGWLRSVGVCGCGVLGVWWHSKGPMRAAAAAAAAAAASMIAAAAAASVANARRACRAAACLPQRDEAHRDWGGGRHGGGQELHAERPAGRGGGAAAERHARLYRVRGGGILRAWPRLLSRNRVCDAGGWAGVGQR